MPLEAVGDQLGVTSDIVPAIREVLVTVENTRRLVGDHMQGFSLVGGEVAPVLASRHNTQKAPRQGGDTDELPVVLAALVNERIGINRRLLQVAGT